MFTVFCYFKEFSILHIHRIIHLKVFAVENEIYDSQFILLQASQNKVFICSDVSISIRIKYCFLNI